jgi:hypothetical protein
MPDATQFAAAWIAAWNQRDVDRVLADYADSVMVRSPTATAVVPAANGQPPTGWASPTTSARRSAPTPSPSPPSISGEPRPLLQILRELERRRRLELGVSASDLSEVRRIAGAALGGRIGVWEYPSALVQD